MEGGEKEMIVNGKKVYERTKNRRLYVVLDKDKLVLKDKDNNVYYKGDKEGLERHIDKNMISGEYYTK